MSRMNFSSGTNDEPHEICRLQEQCDRNGSDLGAGEGVFIFSPRFLGDGDLEELFSRFFGCVYVNHKS